MQNIFECDCGWLGSIDEMTAKAAIRNRYSNVDDCCEDEYCYHCPDCGNYSEDMECI